ncbi:enoyl-CoA hydratase/isomerase family protein [Fodinicola acaciae]|uniref:enoyl-CoA hydratase/isomerase family protein n=1 Tax=Fodinicola acaciae TaxID=2681555 RepID=UPI0013D7BFB3|nr:enoyl-CoA hydratase/isomerase family protein [Fodinicola acaciae]
MIETSEQDGVGVLTLARGPVNVLDLEVLTALPNALAAVEAPAVVITGAGRCFSAGVDLKRIVDGGPAYVAEFLPALSDALYALFTYPKPVVAAINGHALAGGCVLAAACDVRLMSSGTIGLTELAVGLPFPPVPLEIMRHVVGPVASRMVLVAGRLQAAEAVPIDLVDGLVSADELLPAAVRQARQLASVPADVYAFSKDQLRRPALERIAATRAMDDARTVAMWSTDRARDELRAVLANLGK